MINTRRYLESAGSPPSQPRLKRSAIFALLERILIFVLKS